MYWADLQPNDQGANILLAYFHYCNKGLHPFTPECKRSDLQNLAKLDEEAIRYVESTRIYVEKYSKFTLSCIP